MRLSDIIRRIERIFEKKRKNPIQIEDDSNLESKLKNLKVGDINTPIQVSTSEVSIVGSTTSSSISVGDLTISDNIADFGNTTAGFTQFEPTYDSSDTEVDFKTLGNKAKVTLTGNVTDMNLNFPDVSGNFVLLVTQDGTGSRTVTNWKAFDSGGSAANGSATVKWAGGSNPTLTTTADKLDIVSIYWDYDNEIAYGVASLNF